MLLARRPSGRLAADDFSLVTGSLPEPAEGEALCRTILLSIDPANRAWMQGRTYRDQLDAGEVMAGFTISEVVDGNDTGLSRGTLVAGDGGWQDYAALPARRLRAVEPIGPLTHEMSVLGITGLTAYFGLLSVGRPQPGETVLVSAAAGATGNVVGQLARIHGCRVVGICGSDRKGRLLTDELGFDAAVSYRSDRFAEELRQACPQGVDVYFDNVGGPVLERTLGLLRERGRVVFCGAVAHYDGDDRTGGISFNPGRMVVRRLRLEGFLVSDFLPEWPSARTALAGWVEGGSLQVLEDVVDGLDAAPTALVGLLAGDNVGKRIVRVAPDPHDPERVLGGR